jgi:hypothetical protein
MSSTTKKQFVEMCIKHNIEYVDIEWNDNRLKAYRLEKYDNGDVTLCGDTIKLTFDATTFLRRPTINQPFVQTVNELRLGIVNYL